MAMRMINKIEELKMKSSYSITINPNDEKVVHVIDLSGTEDEACRSVTNDIENIIQFEVAEKRKMDPNDFRFILYGTDNIISEFDYQTRNFRFVHEDDEIVHGLCKTIMNSLYSNK